MPQDKDFNYNLRFAGIDKLTPALAKIQKSIGTTSKELRAMKTAQKQFGKFKTLRENSKKLQADLKNASRETADLGRQISKTSNPSRKMTADFKRAQKAVQALKQQQAKEIQELAKLGKSLKKAGHNTQDLGKGQRKLKSDIARSTRELETHRRKLKGVSDQYRRSKDARDKYQKSLQTSANLAVVGASGVAVGTRTLKGAYGFVDSVRSQENNIGRLNKLGKTDDDIKAIRPLFEEIADKFAYIETSDIFGANYDVVSALSGLDNAAQAHITGYSAVLGRAVDASASEMTALATTAHGMFKGQNKDLSDIEFFDEFASTIAGSVKAFKTTGPKMEQAFRSAGPIAASIGFSMEEYAAILGAGQKTMESGDVGTAFASYANGIVKAQEAFAEQGFDIQLLDENNQARGISDVLKDFKAEFGDEWDGEEQAIIKDAFGRKEAQKFLESMRLAESDMLAGLEQIQANKTIGLAAVENMALRGDQNGDAEIQKAIEDLRAMKKDIGYALLPVLKQMIPTFQKITRGIRDFTEKHKTLVGFVGMGVVIFGLLATVFGGLTIALASILGPMAILKMSLGVLGIKGLKLAKILPILGKGLLFAGKGVMFVGRALLMNPIGLAITAIALGAFLIIKYWKPIKAFFGQMWGYFKTVFAWSPLGLLMRGFGAAFKWLRNLFGGPKDSAQKTWKFFKFLFAWSPLGLFTRGIGAGFRVLKSIIGSPRQAARKTWATFKTVMAWSPVGLVTRGIGGGFKVLKSILRSPRKVASKTWNGFKTVMAWSPLGLMKKGWDSLPDVFSSIFGKLKKLTGAAMDKIKGFLSGPMEMIGKFKKIFSFKGLKDKVKVPDIAPVIKTGAAIGAVALSPAPALAQLSPGPNISDSPLYAPAPAAVNEGDTIIHVHAAQGMDEKSLAALVAKALEDHERKKKRRTNSALSDIED